MSVTRNYMSKSLKTGLKLNLVYISKPLHVISIPDNNPPRSKKQNYWDFGVRCLALDLYPNYSKLPV